MHRSLLVIAASSILLSCACQQTLNTLDDVLSNLNSNANANSNSNANANANQNTNTNTNGNTNQNRNNSAITALNGNWQLTLLDRNGSACLAIRDGAVTSWNDGCANTFLTLTNSQPVSRAGDRAVWTFQLVDGDGTRFVTLDAEVQSDGNLVAQLLIEDETGQRTEEDVIIVRR